jgi:hypothetical protein
MREGLAGQRIGVGSHVGFRQQIADRVVGEGLGDADPNGRRGQPVERVIGEAEISVHRCFAAHYKPYQELN